MLRRLASNLGGVAARSGRGAFGAVPAVHAQQRSAGGLMVVRLPAPRCPIRAGDSRGSRGAAPRTPSRGRSRHGVVMATRRARSRPGLRPTRPPRDRSRANPHDHSSRTLPLDPFASAPRVERCASGLFWFREIRKRRKRALTDPHVKSLFFSSYTQHRDTPDNNDRLTWSFSEENMPTVREILQRYPPTTSAAR